MSAAIKCAGCSKHEDTEVDPGFQMSRAGYLLLPEGWFRIAVSPHEPAWASEVWDVCSKECGAVALIRWAGMEEAIQTASQALVEKVERGLTDLGLRPPPLLDAIKLARADRAGDSDSLRETVSVGGEVIGTFDADGGFVPAPASNAHFVVPVPGEDPQWVIPKVELEEDFEAINWALVGGRGSSVTLGSRPQEFDPQSALILAAWLVTVAGIVNPDADLPRFMAILDRVRST